MHATETTTAANTLPEMTSSGLLDAARALLALAPALDDADLARALEVFNVAYRQMGTFVEPLRDMSPHRRAEADALSEARRTAERATVLALARRPGRSAWAGTTRLVLDHYGDLLILDPSRIPKDRPSLLWYRRMMARYPEPASRSGVAS